MPWTTPETFTAGQTLTAASMNVISGDLNMLADIGNSNAWTSFTPTWTNVTVGNATQTCAYLKVGRLVIVRLRIVWGSTTSSGGQWTATLPVTAASVYSSAYHTGLALVTDSGTNEYVGSVRMVSTTTAEFLTHRVDGTYTVNNTVSNTVPMTWTTNDALTAQFMYESAS